MLHVSLWPPPHSLRRFTAILVDIITQYCSDEKTCQYVADDEMCVRVCVCACVHVLRKYAHKYVGT